MSSSIEQVVAEFRAEAEIDFLNVPFLAASVRCEFGLRTREEIRRCTLDVVRRLMALDVFPGDYTLKDLESGRGFQFRPGTPDELLSWIESEWIAMGHTPNLEDPICWFALKRSQPA